MEKERAETERAGGVKRTRIKRQTNPRDVRGMEPKKVKAGIPKEAQLEGGRRREENLLHSWPQDGCDDNHRRPGLPPWFIPIGTWPDSNLTILLM